MVMEKVELVCTHMPNEQLETVKQAVFGMVDGDGIRGRPKSGLTISRNDARWTCTSKHSGAIKNRMEAVCETRG